MAKATAACGTTAGYQRHVKTLGEPACDDCKEAWRFYASAQRHGGLAHTRPPRPCRECGAEFSPKRSDAKRCGNCRPRAPRPRVCRACSVPVGKSKQYCESCAPRRRRRSEQERERYRQRDPQERSRAQRRYRERRNAQLQRLLSDVPLGPTRKDIPPEFRPTRGDMPAPQSCDWCNLDFYHCRPHRFCSESCRDFSIPGRRATVSDLQAGECRRCGDAYCVSALRAPGFCSTECLTRHRRSLRKRQRRTLKRAGDGYTLREIAERDGWRCHLCGGKVPDREYAARDKDATVDHLIPVSAGGDDIRSNVALAHNRCNWERGNAGLAQLRLVG